MNFEDIVLRCSESEGFQDLSRENHDYAFLAADNKLSLGNVLMDLHLVVGWGKKSLTVQNLSEAIV